MSYRTPDSTQCISFHRQFSVIPTIVKSLPVATLSLLAQELLPTGPVTEVIRNRPCWPLPPFLRCIHTHPCSQGFPSLLASEPFLSSLVLYLQIQNGTVLPQFCNPVRESTSIMSPKGHKHVTHVLAQSIEILDKCFIPMAACSPRLML